MFQIRAFITETVLLLRMIASDRPSWVTFLVLIVIVLMLIAIYVIAAFSSDLPVSRYLFHEIGLSRDKSIAEIFSYGMSFMAAVLFFLAALENRSRILVLLACLMAFIWFDDAFSYHEGFGRILVSRYDWPAIPGLRQQDTGELVAWIIADLLFGILFLFAFMRRRLGDLGVLGLFSVGFALLVFCGVLIDFAHVAAGPPLDGALDTLEDGGQMIAIACLAGLAIGISRCGKDYYQKLAVEGAQTSY